MDYNVSPVSLLNDELYQFFLVAWGKVHYYRLCVCFFAQFVRTLLSLSRCILANLAISGCLCFYALRSAFLFSSLCPFVCLSVSQSASLYCLLSVCLLVVITRQIVCMSPDTKYSLEQGNSHLFVVSAADPPAFLSRCHETKDALAVCCAENRSPLHANPEVVLSLLTSSSPTLQNRGSGINRSRWTQ
jgi:hypothetical protein